jgi:hypothetical protein
MPKAVILDGKTPGQIAFTLIRMRLKPIGGIRRGHTRYKAWRKRDRQNGSEMVYRGLARCIWAVQ